MGQFQWDNINGTTPMWQPQWGKPCVIEYRVKWVNMSLTRDNRATLEMDQKSNMNFSYFYNAVWNCAPPVFILFDNPKLLGYIKSNWFQKPKIQPTIKIRQNEWPEDDSYSLRDHPFITSAYFWTFSDPFTTQYVSLNKRHQKWLIFNPTHTAFLLTYYRDGPLVRIFCTSCPWWHYGRGSNSKR